MGRTIMSEVQEHSLGEVRWVTRHNQRGLGLSLGAAGVGERRIDTSNSDTGRKKWCGRQMS